MTIEERAKPEEFYFEHHGYCEVCEKPSLFTAKGSSYFRNTLRCPTCNTAPRNRAVWHYLNQFYPGWRDLDVHECSPGWDRVSQRLVRECPRYIPSQYDPSVPAGSTVKTSNAISGWYRSEDIEKQTFADESFDIVILQDVFEHIFHPDRAARDIARTLRPGGAVIMTVPIVRKNAPSLRRAALNADGTIRHIAEPEYHGNPIGDGRALVTIDWGYDIVSHLQHHSHLSFLMLQMDNLDFGVQADLIEVLIGFKLPIPAL